MDQTGAAFVEAIEPYGLWPLLLVGAGIALIGVLCVFVLPTWRKNLEAQQELESMKAKAQIEIEREREARKAEEAKIRDERDKERTALDAKTTVILEGLKTTIDTLVSNQEKVDAEIRASRQGSQKMGGTVEDTNAKTTEVLKESHQIHALVENTNRLVNEMHHSWRS